MAVRVLAQDGLSDLLRAVQQRRPAARNTLDSARIPRASKLLICGLFQKGRVLAQDGVDTSVIALWLGHESVETTQIYLHADLAIKERALAKTALPNTRPGRFRPQDQLLAFLESL